MKNNYYCEIIRSIKDQEISDNIKENDEVLSTKL